MLLDRLEFTKGLGFRLAALLSVAILPIGMISLFQNLHLSEQAMHSNEIALLGRTGSAASGERALLQSALGSADALGPAVLEAMDDPRACSDLLHSFIERSATYSGAVFVPVAGVTQCSSARDWAEPVDMRDSTAFRRFLESPTTQVTSIARGQISQRPVISVIQPLYRDRELLGYIGVSLTQELMRSTHASYRGAERARIVTFNHRGEVLSSDYDDIADLRAVLPEDTELSSLLSRTETTFRALSNSGESRVFAVVPVVSGLVYAVGSWSPRMAGISGFQLTRFGVILLPIALWLATLGVAYFAVYRLVVRHIRELRSQMRKFAVGSRASPPAVLTDAPSEIADVSQTFHNMARILMRDEEALEAAVAEKTVLLKELHHRVKNNLQLIASIINMQSRMIDDPDARRVLRSVQDRVAALATIYRNLYQAEHLDAVEADRLIGDIINQMANASLTPGSGPRIGTYLQPLTLLPDQAVPLSLLATEAFTNALKYAGAPTDEERPWISVSLKSDQPGRAILEIANSVGRQKPKTDSTGLGSQLIEAFLTQLDGEGFAGIEDGNYVLRAPFRVETSGLASPGDQRKVVLTSAARDGAQH